MLDDSLTDRFRTGLRDLRGRIVETLTSWTAPISPDEADDRALTKFKAEQAAKLEVRCRHKGVGWFPNDGPF